MDQRPPSRELRFRQGVCQSRRWRRYEPYPRPGPLFARDMLPTVVDDGTSVEQLGTFEAMEGAFDAGVGPVQQEVALIQRLTWWKLFWATVGVAITLCVVEHVCAVWAKK